MPKDPAYKSVKRVYLDDLSKKQHAPSELPIKSFEFKSLKNASCSSQGDNVYWKYQQVMRAALNTGSFAKRLRRRND